MANYLTIAGKDSANKDVCILWAAITSKGTLYLSDLLTSNEKLADISQVCLGTRLGVVKGVPAIIIPESTPDRLSVDGLLTKMESFKKDGVTESAIMDWFSDLYEKVSKQYPTFPKPESLMNLFRNKESFLDPYFSGALSVKVTVAPTYYLENREDVVAAVAKMNSASDTSAAYVGNSLNQTTKQESATDRFFIALPKYEELSDDESNVQLIPSMNDVFVPFNHPAYYGPFWMNLKDRSEAERLQYLSQLAGRSDIKMRPEDVTQFIDYPVTHILGNDDNNELPIMDNEVDFYNSLIRLIKFDLENNYPDKAEMLYESGALTAHMKGYLEDLIGDILFMNWSCAGMFRIFKVDLDNSEDDDFDDDYDDSKDKSDKLVYEYHKDTNPDGFNGIEFVLGWLKSAAQGNAGQNGKPLGCGVYAEAIVKLARWGERKPRCLKLEGKDLMFNLSTFREVIPQVDFSKLYPIEVNGRELSLGGMLEAKIAIKDDKFCSEFDVSGSVMCPVGFVTVKFFANDQSQINYVSFVDVVTEYRKGNAFIDGVDFVNGKFIVDESRAQSLMESMSIATAKVLNTSDFTYYKTKVLEDFAQEVGVKVKYMNDLHILDTIAKSDSILSIYYKDFSFSTKERLMERIREFATLPTKVVIVNIAQHVLPIYLKVSDKWQATSVSDLLDLVLVQMELAGMEYSTDFYGRQQEDSKDQRVESVVQELSAFGKPKGKKGGSIMVDVSPLIAPVEETDKFYRVLRYADKNDAGEEICYLSSRSVEEPDGRKKTCFLFIGKDELPAGCVAEKDATMDMLLPHLWRVFANIMVNSLEEPAQVRFVSQQTALKVFNELKAKPKE